MFRFRRQERREEQSWETALPLNHRLQVRPKEHALDYASPGVLSRSAFYLVMVPVDTCYVAIPSEAV